MAKDTATELATVLARMVSCRNRHGLPASNNHVWDQRLFDRAEKVLAKAKAEGLVS